MANSPLREVVDVGSIIAETYVIEGLLGEGGMGSVYLASHKRLAGKRVAIKMLHAEVTNEEIFARFKREADIASRLNHPNIVAVHDFNVTPGGIPYLILEYLHGESLGARIAAGPMPLEQVMSIARQVGSGLAAAHREGIVHRDLKPGNIYLVPTEVDGKLVEIAKILDFGISKIRGSTTVKTMESTLLGTPQYMAPEQAKGDHQTVDERTDIFALGAIVYEMLSGHPAFSGNNIPEVVFKVVYEQPRPLASLAPAAPERVVAAVNQAMAKPAVDRFKSVNGFVEALTGQPVSVFQAPAATSAGIAPGVRIRQTGAEAFDNTMHSVDEGRSPILPDKGSGTVSLRSSTLDSESGRTPKPDFLRQPVTGTALDRPSARNLPQGEPPNAATRVGRRSSMPPDNSPAPRDALAGAHDATAIGPSTGARPIGPNTASSRGAFPATPSSLPGTPAPAPPSPSRPPPEPAPEPHYAAPSRSSFPEMPTTASQGGAFATQPPSVAGTPAPPVAPPGPQRRSPLLIVGVAVAAAAIAVGVMYVVMRGGGGDDTKANAPGSAPVAAAQGDAAAAAPMQADAAPTAPTAVDAAIAAAPADAAVATSPPDAAVVALAPADAAPKRAPQDAAQRISPVERPDAAPATTKEDPGVAQDLRDAEGALARNDTAMANNRAQGVVNSPDASYGQRVRAAIVLGILACKGDDIGNARRWIREYPATRAQIVAGCRRNGQPNFSGDD